MSRRTSNVWPPGSGTSRPAMPSRRTWFVAGREPILAARSRQPGAGGIAGGADRRRARRGGAASAGGGRGARPPIVARLAPDGRPAIAMNGPLGPPDEPDGPRRSRRPRPAGQSPRGHRRRLPLAARPLGRAPRGHRPRTRLADGRDGRRDPDAGQAAPRRRRRPPGAGDHPRPASRWTAIGRTRSSHSGRRSRPARCSLIASGCSAGGSARPCLRRAEPRETVAGHRR